MNRKTSFAVGGGLMSVALLAGAFAVTEAQQPAPPVPDRGKRDIEIGTKVVVAPPQPMLTPEQIKALADKAKFDPAKLDIRKSKIEGPTEALLVQQRAIAEAAKKVAADATKDKVERPIKAVIPRADAAKTEADKGFVNPKVPPGNVTWHDDFAAACAASAKSGKPVLLFQMMGKLDDKFC